MQVILLENIERLGRMGDVVSVKEGYARNYLIPNNKAKPATAGNMKILELLKKKESIEEEKKLEAAKALADKISSISLTINAQAGEEDKLYGSISNEDIASALAAEGINIDKRDIILPEPIKSLGVYQVSVKVGPEIKANLKLWVIKNR